MKFLRLANCCVCLSLKFGCVTFGIFELIGSAIGFIGAIVIRDVLNNPQNYPYVQAEDAENSKTLQINFGLLTIGHLVQVAITITMLVGVLNKITRCLMIWMVYSCGYVIIFFIITAVNSDRFYQNREDGIAGYGILSAVAFIVIKVYSILIVYNLYIEYEEEDDD